MSSSAVVHLDCEFISSTNHTVLLHTILIVIHDVTVLIANICVCCNCTAVTFLL